MWADEKIGDLSHGARLLFIGLITMADDEGRLRALTSLILGHVFPYDNVTPAKLRSWISELTSCGLILTYKVDGKPYIAFRHWKRHQKINRPKESVLPPPPDPEVVTENSVKRHGADMEDAGSHAQARGSRSVPDPEVLPEDFDPELGETAKRCLPILKRTAEAKGAKPVTLLAVARAVESYPRKDHVAVAGALEHWCCHGNGANRPAKDIVARFRHFLANEPDRAPAQSTAAGAGELSKYDQGIRRVQ